MLSGVISEVLVTVRYARRSNEYKIIKKNNSLLHTDEVVGTASYEII